MKKLDDIKTHKILTYGMMGVIFILNEKFFRVLIKP